MIEKDTIPVTETKYIPVAKICDICKKRYLINDYAESQEFHHIRIEGGYYSVFGDEAHLDMDICQHCLKKMLTDILVANNDSLDKYIYE